MSKINAIRSINAKNTKYEIDHTNSLFSASDFLFLYESKVINAINIGATRIKKAVNKEAIPDHFQNSAVNSKRVRPQWQPKTVKSFKVKSSFFTVGFRVLFVLMNNINQIIGTILYINIGINNFTFFGVPLVR